MKTLSRSEVIAVGVVLVVVFGLSPVGKFFFGQTPNPKASTETSQGAAVTSGVSGTVDGLMMQDTTVGNGALVQDGDVVSVHYIGMLTDGTRFDSSYDRGEPITFTVGSGQLITGFDRGVVGMKVGGKRTLTIPPELAYGAQAVGAIPADSTIVFEVELVKIGN